MNYRIAASVVAILIIVPATSMNWRAVRAQGSDRLADGFRRFDTDRDGRVTPAEFPQADLFRRLDRDGDGAVTLDEARAAAAAGALKNVTLPEPGRPVADAATPAPASAEDATEIRQGPKRIKPGDHGVGRRVADLPFRDLAGNRHKLSDFANRKAVVVALTGTGCPLCQKYAPTLAELERRYRDRGVAFVFVNPNESETVDELNEAVRTHGFVGPYGRDTNEEIARSLDAHTTTEAFVLDAARTLVYRGAVDDQYGFAYALDAPRHTYLADALDAVLAGRPPEIAATSAPGCELLFDAERGSEAATDLTYHNRVSRILQDNCLQCHRDGGLARFSLETYDEVRDYAGMIRNVVQRRIMPPWFAAPHEQDDEDGQDETGAWWANDRSLSQADRTDLLAWIQAGVPLGDPADAPLPRKFPDDWMIGDPDVVVQIPDPISIKATGRMPYQHVGVKTDFAEDRWVQAVEIQPTNRAVVHHVLVFVQEADRARAAIDERDGFFAAYVPGNSYQRYPSNLAKKLPAGATLIFQLHYTPNGTATNDQTRLGLVFAKEPPQHVVRNVGIANHRISIPPGADNHAEQAVLNVPADVRALAFMPHMHLRGKAFRYELVSPGGEKKSLLDVPRYDFNWQLEYRLAEPLDIPRGSRIELTGWYDNSAGNPANPDPTVTVGWGPQTEDEMMLGYVEYYVPSESIAGAAHSTAEPKKATQNPGSDSKLFEGLWAGSWGGGEAGGVVFQPVMAEMLIDGDHVELAGFPELNRLVGTVRFDAGAKRMQITPAVAAGDESKPEAIEFSYELEADELTLTGSDKSSVSLSRIPLAHNPSANVQVEFVTADAINEAGELLVTDFNPIRAGRRGTTFFRPSKRSLDTKQATVLLAQETGCKPMTLDEARERIHESTPVVLTYRPENRPLPDPSHALWQELYSPLPDSEAVRQTLAQILRPGTIVFVLPASERVPSP